MSLRLGFFGGSFDPPHRGHLAVASAAALRFALNRVILVPTGVQPLKPVGAFATFENRYQMVSLACEGQRLLEPSRLDAPRTDGSSNYTVDALQNLRKSLHADDAIFVLVGIDAFMELRSWRQPERLLSSADWIVVSRPGHLNTPEQFLPLGLTEDQRARVHLLNGIAEPESSTSIRARLAAGEDCDAMLAAPVLGYIRSHHLYGT